MTFLFDHCTSLLNGLIASILPCYSFFLYVEIRDSFKAKSVCCCFVWIPSVPFCRTQRKHPHLLHRPTFSTSLLLRPTTLLLFTVLQPHCLVSQTRCACYVHNIIVPGTWKALKTRLLSEQVILVRREEAAFYQLFRSRCRQGRLQPGLDTESGNQEN